MIGISLIGASGSIGSQVKEVVRRHPDRFRLTAITVHTNIKSLMKDIAEFSPQFVGVSDESAFEAFQKIAPKNLDIASGTDALLRAACLDGTDVVVVSVVGMCGLRPVVKALEAGKRLALANKEALVAGGQLVMDLASKNNITIMPIDSEHSAVFQALHSGRNQDLKRIVLTASGGPFRTYDLESMKSVTLDQTLKHPTWNMGKKITVDSATLLNKGLEVIEAYWLFGTDKIEAVIHPQSIIHSMVEFCDNSVIAQMSYPTMEIPIQLALSYPQRLPTAIPSLDFARLNQLTFEPIDLQKYPCFALSLQALRAGGFYPVILNSANELAVQRFLQQKISFLDIHKTISRALDAQYPTLEMTVDNVFEMDKLVRSRL